MILLAMPDVDELFPVELKVEAALELWLNSESSDSRVLNEFLDFVILDNCILEWWDCIDFDDSATESLPTTAWSTMLQLSLLPMLVIDLFLHFLMGVGENEEMEEFELETGDDWLRTLLAVLLR